MQGESTPIPPFAEDCLDVLSGTISPPEPGIDEASAKDALMNEGFTRANAREALEVLEMRGYIYRVNSEIRVTD
ncbi:hypothetical protein [Haloarchaeobius amylolyticus]|uniref:hypothetical protein n=1 Tax=Haloarchaeobius amylolyticus TaxID=1198296 RepID=UPI0022700B6E|nr:hypothetical protein [Haloarchaeobius amylolyticus]